MIRLRMERGETEQPRAQLDLLLAGSDDQPPSLFNSWRAERLRLATTLDDALRWAAREEVDPYSEESSKDAPNPPVLAEDAAYLLNYRLPLSKLTVAAHSTTLPSASTSNLALATWTRAFLLNDFPALTDVSPLVLKAHPDWADSLAPAKGQSLEEWGFRAALLVALHHEFEPVVSVGYQSGSDLNTWWCPVSEPHASQSDDEAFDVSWHLPVMFTPPAAVVSEREKTAAAAEVKSLGEKGPAQAALAPIIFNWAKSHPDDPLVPQALHRLVVVVRYGCPGEGKSNGQISKTAFDLLHKRYPNSPWTAKTPYWFDQ